MTAKEARSFFTFDPETADRLKQMTYRLSAEEGRRVTYKDLLGRALDALEREITAGKPPERKKKKN